MSIRSAALFSFVLAGCSASATPASVGEFPKEPLLTAPTQGGAWNIAVRTAPDQPPSRGTNLVELTITTSDGAAPVEGLSIAVTPWMPAMGHGGSVIPTVVPEEPGVYLLENVSFYMPGQWELRTSLSGVSHDSIVVPFDIQ